MRQRLMVVGVVVSLLAIAPMWKLIGVQLRNGADLVARGESQRFREVTLTATRGSIVDRNGVELAISVTRKRVAVSISLSSRIDSFAAACSATNLCAA